MPPKTPVDDSVKADNNVKILVELIRTATEFKADTTQMAEVCGLTAAKNVPRKINAIIGPYGFELKAGKIVSKDGSDGNSDKADKASDSTKAPPKTPKTPKAPKTPKTPKNPTAKAGAKKRKLDHAASEDDEVEPNGAEKEESTKDEASIEDVVKDETVAEDVSEEPGLEEEEA